MNGNNKKNKSIILIVIVISIACLLGGTTYAFWTLTKIQADSNKIVASCLKLEFSNGDSTVTSVNLEDAMPSNGIVAISSMDGYDFKITNECDRDIDFKVGLENTSKSLSSVTSAMSSDSSLEYDDLIISGDSIDVAIDDTILGTITELKNMDSVINDSDNTYELLIDTVEANSSNTYNFKMWLNQDSLIDDANKDFASKLVLTASIDSLSTPEECFTMIGTTIVDYDSSCGDEVIIPATINGVHVEEIDTNAFRDVTYNYDAFSVVDNDGAEMPGDLTQVARIKIYFDDVTGLEAIKNQLDPSSVGTVACILESTFDEYGLDTSDFDSTCSGVDLSSLPELETYPLKSFTSNEMDYLIENDYGNYMSMYQSDNICFMDSYEEENCDRLYDVNGLSINSVDFSLAKYLNKINLSAFSIYNDSCNHFDANNTQAQIDAKNYCSNTFYNSIGSASLLEYVRFGRNNNSIEIENFAFAGSSLESLDVYSNITSNSLEEAYQDSIDSASGTLVELASIRLGMLAVGAIPSSNIDTLTIKKDSSTIDPTIQLTFSSGTFDVSFLQGSTIRNLVYQEGITTISACSPLAYNIYIPSTVTKFETFVGGGSTSSDYSNMTLYVNMTESDFANVDGASDFLISNMKIVYLK